MDQQLPNRVQLPWALAFGRDRPTYAQKKVFRSLRSLSLFVCTVFTASLPQAPPYGNCRSHGSLSFIIGICFADAESFFPNII